MNGKDQPHDVASGTKLRERLKVETRAEHVELENRMAILSPDLTTDRYFEILKIFQSLHRQIEETLALVDSDMARDYIANRRKSAFLHEDLAQAPESSQLLPELDLRWMSDSSHLLGALYVIEGSTLGGQVVSRSLTNLHPGIPVRYFSGYRSETGKMWQSFISRLTEVPLEEHDAVVLGARNMFNTFLEAIPPLTVQK